jgi:hypothetical protein
MKRGLDTEDAPMNDSKRLNVEKEADVSVFSLVRGFPVSLSCF